jgi:hypothetical protein
LLRAAIHVVFGVPFLCSLVVAIRLSLWWRNVNLLSDRIGSDLALLWTSAAALGMLWLGVLFLLTPAPPRKYAGALLVIVGSAVLFTVHR